jgi:DHA1 family bicyclomycin/chloramphenicol resistance-like MFS transporter
MSREVSTQEQSLRQEDMGAIRPAHVLVLGGLSAIGPLSTDMYLPALPALSADLGATMAQAQVTLSAGILGLALGQLLAGPGSDSLGRRRPLLVGLGAFVLASLLCLVAPSIGVLTALRFVQGFAGAAGITIALAMASDMYRGAAQARLFALLTQVSGLAPIVAPIIGGQLLRAVSWHGIFAALALVGAGLFAAALRLGETLPPQRRRTGGGLSALKDLGGLIGDRGFVGYALASGLAFASGIVYISASPFVLERLYGASPQTTGIIFGVNAIGIVLLAQVSGRLAGRVAPQTLLLWGGALMALGGAALLGAVLLGVELVGLLPPLFVVVASLGLVAPNATALALADVRAAGSASALLGVLQLSIGALGAPLVGLAGATSALPMAVAIAGFSGLTLLMAALMWRGAPEGRPR